MLAFASTRKSSGNFQQFENGATSVGVTYGIYKTPIRYTDATLLNWQTESGAVVVAEDTQHPPFQYDNIHPTWTPEETVNTITGLTEVANRIAYASNSGIPYSTSAIQYTSPRSNYDIWSSELVDLTPPSPLELPSVTPRLVAPGQPVTIKARFADLSSGVQHIFVQIKNPNSYLQDPSLPSLRNPIGGKDAGPYGDFFYDGHRVYEVYNYFYPHVGTPNSLRGSYQEVGYQPINPGTDSYFDGGRENLPFDLTGVFPFAFSGSPAGDISAESASPIRRLSSRATASSCCRVPIRRIPRAPLPPPGPLIPTTPPTTIST
ncbi:MAG: hypothetical protein LC772_03945 [Chloroflexi bacterium]|nr:hypothetical protein [Chloroflexota bacterium]